MRRYDPKLKPYNKKLEHSYSLGVYPTLDLILNKADRVLKVLLKEEGKQNEGVERIMAACEAQGLKYEFNNNIVDKLSVKENTYAIGVFQKYQPELDQEANHIVLDQPRNMGNIGTIIRTMVGFRMNNLALIRPAADIFDPKVVRSAMGALFNINFKYYDSFNDYTKESKKQTYYPFMLGRSRDIRQVAIDTPYALIFGNESEGLPEEYSEVGQPVHIPQSKNVDSFNLSVAAGISMWHFASTTGNLGNNLDEEFA